MTMLNHYGDFNATRVRENVLLAGDQVSRSREGTGPSAFERLVRGGSFNFFHTHRGGLSCFLTGFDTHLTQSITKVTPSSSQGRNVSEPLLTMYGVERRSWSLAGVQ